MIEITDTQAAHIIEHREIPSEIVQSSEKVAVILTQDWCPQWVFMKRWLKKTTEKGVDTFYLSYNKKPYFQDFMNAKESAFGNEHVPYVRYYVNGKLVDDSNYVSEELFHSNFK